MSIRRRTRDDQPARPPQGGRGPGRDVGRGAAGPADVGRGSGGGGYCPSPPPTLTDLSTWLTVHANGDVTWRTGHVELGQGNRTALAQMVAEELDVAFDTVTLVMGNTDVTPDQGVTAGSTTIARAGVQARLIAAEARATLLALASQRLGVPADEAHGRATVWSATVRRR